MKNRDPVAVHVALAVHAKLNLKLTADLTVTVSRFQIFDTDPNYCI